MFLVNRIERKQCLALCYNGVSSLWCGNEPTVLLVSKQDVAIV